MKALIRLAITCCFLVGASGCAICCAPDDGTYPVDGGLYQRLDPASGRVGSAFTQTSEEYETDAEADSPNGPTEAEPEKSNSDEPPAPVIATESDETSYYR